MCNLHWQPSQSQDQLSVPLPVYHTVFITLAIYFVRINNIIWLLFYYPFHHLFAKNCFDIVKQNSSLDKIPLWSPLGLKGFMRSKQIYHGLSCIIACGRYMKKVSIFFNISVCIIVWFGAASHKKYELPVSNLKFDNVVVSMGLYHMTLVKCCGGKVSQDTSIEKH